VKRRALGGQGLARLARERVLLHADHDDVVGGDRGLDLGDEILVVAGDGVADRGVEAGLGEHGARHAAL
jgi:hypothetical protein